MKPPAPLTDAFLHDLNQRLKELKIRKTRLAHDIGITKSNLSRYFKKTRSPTGEFILKMQNWLKGINIL